MNSQTETSASPMDTLLLIASVLLLGGGLFAFYYFEAQYGTLPRLGGLAATTVAGILLGSRTTIGRTVWQYFIGARVEMRKIVWPTRQESIQVTLFVAALVLIMALILWGIDSLLLLGVHFLGGVKG